MSALVIIVGVSAYGYFNRTLDGGQTCNRQSVENINMELSDFGINGGLGINNYNGKVSQFVIGEQDLAYRVRGKFERSMMTEEFRQTNTKSGIENAKLISDIVTEYPFNWISDYSSVEIATTKNGREIKEVGPNEVLTLKQQQLIKSVDINSYLAVTVKYKTKNSTTDILETREMNVSVAIVPEVKASYAGGYDEMIKYLKENSLKQIVSKNFSHLPQPTVSFAVNELGETENVKLISTSRDKDIDKLFVYLIKKMPKWEPAKNGDGLPVKQEFVLTVGQNGC